MCLALCDYQIVKETYIDFIDLTNWTCSAIYVRAKIIRESAKFVG